MSGTDRVRSRLGMAAGVAMLAVIAPAGVAFADPAGPTDFRSEVVAVEPETTAITVDVVGGDAFVQITVEPGHEVTITGYNGEPYVQILADGRVQQNRRSPTVAQNASRYGGGGDVIVGTAADVASELPEWEQIDTGGSFVWHDHRAHWMSATAPPGSAPGWQSTGEIPLVVDGVAVTVRVATTLLEPPSRAAAVAGAILGGFAALILVSLGRRQAWLLAVAGAAACGIGWWQFNSLPPATGPSSMWFVLPGIASACGLVALSFGRSLVSHALVLLGGLQLGIWVYLRRESLARAFLPTDAPFWLDRGVTAAAAVASVTSILAGGIALFRLPAGPDPATSGRTSRAKGGTSKPTASKAGASSAKKAKAGRSGGGTSNATGATAASDVTTWGRRRK